MDAGCAAQRIVNHIFATKPIKENLTDRQSAPRIPDKKIHSRYSRLFLFNKEFRQIQSVFYSIRLNADVE